ncbi:MAG: hypothetical protein FJ198_04925 [Gammaproteobacteria bacterium]|nr:hypothetical protein [Gammaproteobacteria bacterium]MBM4209712.1 hypothetical protein [Gammaproteobacteria bacterium]MBM4231051.1 hypothetical protein [Gammaproteobacteria bacterium]
MRLTVTPSDTRLLIRGYAAGKLRIGDREITSSVVLSATQLHTDLVPQQPAELAEADLAPVFADQPEVVVIGWAGGQTFLPAAQRRWFLERGIGIEVMELGAACRTYNVLVGDGRRVVAILFPR